ncbi:hypothetical protein AB4090_14960, partial [Acidithiobacillus sp. IBUN Pt1247-S3]|uniref:hypothetical protein n=1 Tax=Acidithiobacillus sp. IBUN Pt1247-S3 TaxID=3166642 RepID=UPI0034E44CC4
LQKFTAFHEWLSFNMSCNPLADILRNHFLTTMSAAAKNVRTNIHANNFHNVRRTQIRDNQK